jgi:glycosyltransferase involved in cell wall biosynthesis
MKSGSEVSVASTDTSNTSELTYPNKRKPIMLRRFPKVIALLAVYNEERFVAACLEHLIAQDIQAYLIDNGSIDQTAKIAARYLGRGLINIENFPRGDFYTWRPLLERKEELANSLDADWFMNLDADEIRLAPSSDRALPQAFREVEQLGFNAVNFQEFTFIPTREEPDHDHPAFQRTMKHYYPFSSSPAPTQVKAWKRQNIPVRFAWSAGHTLQFDGLRIAPYDFVMKHYMFLSVAHAHKKYMMKKYDPDEVEAGWHRARAALRPELIKLPAESDLRLFLSDDKLDASNPRSRHYLLDRDWASRQEDGGYEDLNS